MKRIETGKLSNSTFCFIADFAWFFYIFCHCGYSFLKNLSIEDVSLCLFDLTSIYTHCYRCCFWKMVTSDFVHNSVISFYCFSFVFWFCVVVVFWFLWKHWHWRSEFVFIWFNKYLYRLLLLLFFKNGNKWLCSQKPCFGVMV